MSPSAVQRARRRVSRAVVVGLGASAVLDVAVCLVAWFGNAGKLGQYPVAVIVASAGAWALQLWGLGMLVRRGRRTAAWATSLERRACGVAELTDDMVWEMTPEGTMTYLDHRAGELFGWSAAQLTGRSIFTLLHPDEAWRASRILASAIEHATGWNEEIFHIVRADGDDGWIRTSGVANLITDGSVRGFTATSRLCLPGELAPEVTARAERIDKVLREELLAIAFQPIVCVKTGRVVGVEALSRFTGEPAQGPDRWFADAEHAGRGCDLEILALRTAATAALALPANLYVSLNVSPATLVSPVLLDILTSLDGAGRRVLLEITEHVSIGDYDALLVVREQLRVRGVGLAVDDAGAGYASFRHILRLHPDVIKLDRTIISGLDTDPGQRALAGALIAYATQVGSNVVAEGIETPAELAAVTALGVEAAQGYLLGRPTMDRTVWQQWCTRPIIETPSSSKPPARPRSRTDDPAAGRARSSTRVDRLRPDVILGD